MIGVLGKKSTVTMIYEFGAFEVDTDQFEILSKGARISVEPKVFDLLVYLINHRERVLSRNELFENIWDNREVSDASLSNHIKSARKILGDDAEKQRLIKTVRGRGYQWVADTQVRKKSSQLIAPKLSRNLYKGVIGSLILTVAALLYYQLIPSEPIQKLHPRVAVLPFVNIQPDDATNYLGFSIADQIIGNIANSRQLTVRGSGSIRQYIDKEIDISSVGSSLDVEYVLMGTYQTRLEQLKINVELIEIASNQLQWRASFDPLLSHSNSTFAEISDQLVTQFGFSNETNISENTPESVILSPLAYEYYLRSIAYPETNRGARLSIAMLEKAIELAPDFSPNYVELGKRTHFLTLYNLNQTKQSKSAIEHFKKALSLDSNSHQALSALAQIYTETDQTYKAVELLQRLIEQYPNDANAYFSLGYLFRYTGMLTKSIEAFESAIAIDRRSRWVHNLAIAYYNNGENNRALELFNFGEQTPFSHAWKATVYIHQGDKDKALEHLNTVISTEPGGFWEYDSIGYRSIIDGQHGKGIEALKKLEAANVNDGEALFYWASVYAMLGEKESSLRMLKQSFAKGFFNLPLYQSESFLDPIRETQEFKDLLQSVEEKHFLFKRTLLDSHKSP
jgi:DNA-binding winged helix-turn-helix (wHTH) protein/tetratricopeptide (TPR) repeat protein